QVGAGKIRAIEARAAESGIHQPRTTEVGVLQPRVRKVHLREHGAHQVRFDERRLIQARPAKFCEAKIDRTTLDAPELAFGYRNVEIIQHRDDTRILTPPRIPGASARTQHLDVRRIRCRLRPSTRPRGEAQSASLVTMRNVRLQFHATLPNDLSARKLESARHGGCQTEEPAKRQLLSLR